PRPVGRGAQGVWSRRPPGRLQAGGGVHDQGQGGGYDQSRARPAPRSQDRPRGGCRTLRGMDARVLRHARPGAAGRGPPMSAYLEHYRNRKVLVTGGAGAIGSNLCRRLSELGATTFILDDLSSSYEWNVPQERGILFVEGSVTDEVCLKRVFG